MSRENLKIAAIGGGSSYTPELIEGFIKRHKELPAKDIYLVDIEEGREKLEIAAALARRMVKKAGVDITIHTTLDRREALKDADFVITQLRVGLMDARIRDEKIPLRYDAIGQETTGAGGFANALRTVPVILDICKDMEELCPNAWLINFTNPSGIVTEAVLNHTKIKAIGLCNVPYGMASTVAGYFDVPFEDVYVEYVGINHLAWGTKMLVKGRDVTDEAIEKLCNEQKETLKNIPEVNLSPKFIRSLHMFPVGYLKYYYLTSEMLDECKKAAETVGTRGEVVKKVEAKLFELYKNPELDTKPKELEQRGGAHYSDAACSLINSIYNNKRDIQIVNCLNNGTIKDLPDNASIERNCIIDGQGAHPISYGYVSPKIRGLLQVVKAYEQLTVDAAINGNYDSALQALTIHPLVPSSNAAIKILNDIIKENSEYLPQFH